MGKSKRIEKVKNLQINQFDEWIMAKRQINISIDELGKNILPDLLICVSEGSGDVIGTTVLAPNPPETQVIDWALKCMTSPMTGRPCRPFRITLTEETIDFLDAPLAQFGIQVVIDPNPDPIIDGLVDLMENESGSLEEFPPYLDEPSMDAKTVADFFSVAAEFYKAKPWKLFEYEIPIKLDFGGPDKKCYWAVVMGVLGQDFGVSIYRSAEELEDLLDSDGREDTMVVAQRIYSMGFSFDDYSSIGSEVKAEFLRHEWGIADKRAYPTTLVTDPNYKRIIRQPNKQELADLTIAMAAIIEFLNAHKKGVKEQARVIADVVSVEIANKTIHVGLTLPAPEFMNDYEDDDDYEESERRLTLAFGMVRLAAESKSKGKRVKLAKQALELSRDCVSAYLLLAEETNNIKEETEYLTQAVAAGERIIGIDNFKKFNGQFWDIPETRPYMLARHYLANFKATQGQTEEAIKDYQDMLKLNKNDNRCVHFVLANYLVLENRDDELKKLLDNYKEAAAFWLYTKALHSFRTSGDTKKTAKDLDAALKSNPHVVDYLLGRKSAPPDTDKREFLGTEAEAMVYTMMFLEAWKSSKGAMQWLEKASAI